MRTAHLHPAVWPLAMALAFSGLFGAGSSASAAGNGHITGTLTGPDHRPAPGVSVTAFTWQPASGRWEPYAATSTVGNGSYDLGGLSTDTYRLCFSGINFNGSGEKVQTECWDDAASVEAARDISVWGGAVYPGFDAELAEEGGPRIANTSPPTISGTAQAGSTLTADAGTWEPSTGLTLAYEWMVGGKVVGTGPSYTPTEYVGQPVRVQVTARTDGYRPRTVESAPTAALAMGPAPAFQTLPTLGGTAQVGVEVTATPGTWTPAAGPSRQEWLVDGVVVDSGPTYRPVAADVGKSLQARTSAWTTWLSHTYATSGSVKVAPGTLVNTMRPRAGGTPRVPHKLIAAPGSWSPTVSTFTYQWLRDGKAIRGARHRTYKLPRTAKRHRFSVRVTARLAGYNNLTATSSRTVKIS